MRTLSLLLLLLIALPAYAEEAFVLRSIEQTNNSYLLEVYAVHTSVPINAVEGTLVLPPTARASHISTGGSIVGFWVEQPVLENNSIRFSGIFPGGFTNVMGGSNAGDGLLFSIELTNVDSVTLENSAYFLNDGEGTRIEVPAITKVLADTDEGKTVVLDTHEPEWLEVERVSAEEIEEGKEMLVVSAYDGGSGVAYFEVKESGGEWKRTQTPYLIENESLFNRIQVRAYDYAGNVKEISVESPLERIVLSLAPYLLAGILLVFLLVYLRKRRKRTL